MGIIKAVGQAIGGGFKDLWLDVFEADDMGDQVIFTSGVRIRKGQNTKYTENTVSNGSYIHVYDNQFMMIVDGGKIVDYTAEPGYYVVDNSSMPSALNGEFGETLSEAFDRMRFGGETPRVQKVFFINLQEIKGIKFGTPNPLQYFDNFYNAELRLRAFGSYSIKVTNPLQFYSEVIPKNMDRVLFEDVKNQYMSEFLGALQASIGQMSVDGVRISHVTSKAMELGKYMASVLDEDWNQMRGMEIRAVGVSNISYDEESLKLIDLRNQGAMLSDPMVREGYVQGAIARGLEAAGSNSNGSMAGFMGMGMGMNMSNSMMGQASQTNLAQMQMQQNAMNAQRVQSAAVAGAQAPQAAPAKDTWTCGCGQVNSGKFCSECGKPAPAKDWTCECGQVNTGRFCSECGKPRA